MANLDLNLRELVRKSRQRLNLGREAASVRLSNISSMSVINLLEATTGRTEDRQRDQQGWTVLHVAARHSKPQTVRLVLEQGGRVSDRDFSGNTPLHLAAEVGNKEAARVLLHHGANVSDKNNAGLSCLHVAVRSCQVDVVPLLLQYAVNVDMLTVTGQRTALHIAASQGECQIGKALLDAGANPRAKASLGWTPLHFSSREGRMDMSALLIGKGGKVDAVTTTGWTPLMFAASYSQLEVAKLLIAKRAKNHLTNRDGLTAADIAEGKGNSALAQIIRGNIGRGAARQFQEERENFSIALQSNRNTSGHENTPVINESNSVNDSNSDRINETTVEGHQVSSSNADNVNEDEPDILRLKRRLEVEMLKLEEVKKKKDELSKKDTEEISECQKELEEANKKREEFKVMLLKVEDDIKIIEQKKTKMIEETNKRKKDTEGVIKSAEEEVKLLKNKIKLHLKDVAEKQKLEREKKILEEKQKLEREKKILEEKAIELAKCKDIEKGKGSIIEQEETDVSIKTVDLTPTMDVESELECPVCFELSKPPIFQCPEGHIICNVCRPKVSRCPVCRYVFKSGLPEIRNRFVERLSRSYFNLE